MDAETLKSRLAEANSPVLIDTLTEASYAAEHIPGAANACVFETAFLGNAEKAVTDKNSTVVVYDTGTGSLGAKEAQRKLTAAGYTQVEIFEGGIEAWKAAGYELEGSGAYVDPAPAAYPDTLAVDIDKSTIRWTGRNLANHHWGHLNLKSGTLSFSGGQLTGGEFVIDMNSISVEDIPDAGMAGYLIAHLQDADFFETATYPEATVTLETVEAIADATRGASNYKISAVLTLKGVANPIHFETTAGWAPDGTFSAQAALEFDRTLWNVLYGSGKFFDRLGMHMVADLIALQIKINAG